MTFGDIIFVCCFSPLISIHAGNCLYSTILFDYGVDPSFAWHIAVIRKKCTDYFSISTVAIYIYIRVCVCVCIYIYIYVYTHTSEWVKVTQSCLTLQPHGLHSPQNSPGQNTGVGSLFLLQGIFPTQGSNPGILHWRQVLYLLSHKGSIITTLALRYEKTHLGFFSLFVLHSDMNQWKIYLGWDIWPYND